MTRPFFLTVNTPTCSAFYLGDGCLSPARRDVYKLRITLDSRYPDIIRECASATAAVLPQSAVAVQPRIGCSEVYSYSKQ